MASLAFSLLGAAPTTVSGVASLVHGIEGLFGKGNGSAEKAAVICSLQSGVQSE